MLYRIADIVALMNILVTNMNKFERRKRKEKNRKKKSNSSMFRFLSSSVEDVYVCYVDDANNESNRHPLKTDMDARNEEKKKEKETSKHTTIKKELYICALTNLPRTTHTLWRRLKHILFFIPLLFSFAVLFCRECH